MKKIVSLVVSAFILTGFTAGCAAKAPVENPQTPTDNASVEKPVLRQLGFQRNFDPNQDPVAAMLEEATGYKVNYEILPLENPNDKLNLMMANKEEIDIVKLSGTQYHKLANEGALEPLDSLLKEHGQTLLAVNDQASWDLAKIDGVTYGVPERAPRPFVSGAIAIRSDVLETVGMELPTTLDQFYELLVAIKEKTDMIPLTGYEGIIHEISGAFGVNAQWQEDGKKIVNRVEDPGMKEYLAFMSKLYTEGLIDQEWPINDNPKAQEKFTNGKAAMMSSYGWGLGASTEAALAKTFPSSTVELIMGLEGKDGQKGAWAQATGIGWYIAIPKASKNKEDAMKYLDLKVQPELFKKLAIGVEGTHFTKNGDRMEPILPKFTDERNNADWFITSTDQEAYANYWLLRTRKDPILSKTFDAMQVQLEYAQKEATTLAPPLETNAKYNQKLLILEKDYQLKVIAGAESVDNYDTFLATWKAEGGEACTVEYNEWFTSK